jgi:dTDP-4-amino-4,6-dideoxygalactose transaminase
MIPFTKPYLPPFEKAGKLMQEIWQRKWVTNNGPLVNEFELKLKEKLNINHFLYLANGTLALQLALKTLPPKGEIITTPFSFIASSSSILWENHSVVFADIDARTFTIDPKQVEKLITPDTSAILATNVFGNTCDIEALEKICRHNNLKLIFDSCHCFGTTYNERSVFDYGDISITSFHATKIVHSIEGGGIFTPDPKLLKTLAAMRNFGQDESFEITNVGINAKNSELHAAIGLLNLEESETLLEKRKDQWVHYQNYLQKDIQLMEINEKCGYNYSMFPIVFKTKSDKGRIVSILNENTIYPKPYFFPSLNTLSFINYQPCPVSESLAERIICLPLFDELSKEEIDMVCRIILRNLRY